MQEPKLEQIFSNLLGAYSHQGVVEWFARPRIQLNGRTPSQAIDDGEIDLVVALAAALGAGVRAAKKL